MGSNGSFSSGKLNKWTNIIYKILYKYVLTFRIINVLKQF